MRHLTHAELPGLVGHELVVTDWLEITQARIDTFADAHTLWPELAINQAEGALHRSLAYRHAE